MASMRYLLQYAALLMSISTVFSQNCPLLGPAYPKLTNPASSAYLQGVQSQFDSVIAQALANGQLDSKTGIFSLRVFSSHSEAPLYEYHYAAAGANGSLSGKTPNSDTLYRIGSLSKVVSVYTILSKLSDTHWEDAVIKYVPELASAQFRNAVDNVKWSDVTLGELAGQVSGIGRDYALADLSTGGATIPGLPALNQSEVIMCGSDDLRACTREESMRLILRKPPVTSTFHTPNYSNMAFQLLSYAIEAITGQPFGDLVKENLLQPLRLKRTFYSSPGNDSNAVIVDGWTEAFGDESPAGGVYQSLGDLSTMGKSILLSSLLPPRTTRKWLQPITHTSALLGSVGRPWEIRRFEIPVSSSTNTTRITDLYTKNGAVGTYLSLLALSPDHDLGISVLTAGPSSTADYNTLVGLASSIWVPAMEEAAREQAVVDFVGTYRSSSDANTYTEFESDPNQPGIFLSNFVSNGTDLLALLASALGEPPSVKYGGWLYPMELSDQGRIAFRAVFGATGTPVPDACASWGSVDAYRYGDYAIDLFIFDVGTDGKATGVEIPVLKTTLNRAA